MGARPLRRMGFGKGTQLGGSHAPTPSYSRPQPCPSPRRRVEGTGSLSLEHYAYAMLTPYQRIIGIGMPAVPLILRELEREPHHWFWALEAITEQNPVPAEALGKTNDMARAWLDWGKRQGLIPA